MIPESHIVPRHHVPFYGDWTTWRWAVLRGTGFPVEMLQRLCFPDCAAAADRIAEAEDTLRQALDSAADAARRALDELQFNDANRSRRNALFKTLNRLNKGKVHAKAAEVLEPALLDAVTSAREEVAAATAAYEDVYQQTSIEQSQTLNDIAADLRFQEAVLWQNRHGYHTAVRKLPGSDPTHSSSARRHREELVAKYVQRYTVKNDTIGFFGPVGWADWNEDADTVAHLEPGAGLLERRSVYFEGWAVMALAHVLMSWPGVMDHLKPQTLPLQWLGEDGCSLHRALGLALAVDRDQIFLLEHATGERSAVQLARDLAADPECGYSSPEEVMGQLHHFRIEGAIAWEFRLPPGPHTLDAVRRQVEEFEDRPLAERCLEKLEELDGSRRGVEAAAGDPERLDSALAAMGETFGKLTGMGATRAAGELYAGRTLVYEDCLRAGTYELGPEIRDTLAVPLAPILHSVRWLTSQVADHLRQELDHVYNRLRIHHGPEVPLLVFWPQLAVHLIDAGLNGHTNEALDDFTDRWRDILGLQPGKPGQSLDEVRWTSEELWPKVREVFATENLGWPQARYSSPDVMLAAESPEALQRGDFFTVLGELHIAYASAGVWASGAQHPDLDALVEVLENDLPEPRLWFDEPHVTNMLSRFGLVHTATHDYVLRNMLRASASRPEQVVEPEDVVMVRDLYGNMRVRSLGEPSFDLDFLSAMSAFLTHGVVTRCRLLPTADHWPRVWIDNMVVHRESWVFDGREMDFVHAETPAERFAGARSWWRRAGVSQRVFLRVATEKKPTYVDFDSPVYVELFTKSVRAALESGGDPRVRMSEMMPDLHQLWLPDAEGNRYTSEVRLVLVDHLGLSPGQNEG